MQPSLQHGGQIGGPTSCECLELFSSQNASREDKYGQILQFLLKKNYLLCCKYAKIASFFTFRSPLTFAKLHDFSEIRRPTSARLHFNLSLARVKRRTSHERNRMLMRGTVADRECLPLYLIYTKSCNLQNGPL